jgi:tetratricopeptide (TPR) repeat protein
MLKKFEEALPWYMRACELEREYNKTAHGSAINIFTTLKYDDNKIFEVMKSYPKLDPFMFYYYLGLAYYDKNKVNEAIKWYERAEKINDKNIDLMNSFGISYAEIKKYPQAEEYYLKCIELNPKYHMAYFNLGILYKA